MADDAERRTEDDEVAEGWSERTERKDRAKGQSERTERKDLQDEEHGAPMQGTKRRRMRKKKN